MIKDPALILKKEFEQGTDVGIKTGSILFKDNLLPSDT